jgi:anti-sigma-K factor RskA
MIKRTLTAALILAAITAGVAQAATPASIAGQTKTWINKRLAFANSSARAVSARCQETDSSDFFCIVKISSAATGAFPVDYNVTIRNGYVSWHSTG